MNRLLYALCLVALLAGLGCGGTSSGQLPVDSPLTPFVPPERDDLVADSDNDDDADMDADAADEDWGDVDETPSPSNEKKSEPTPPAPVKSK
jgi:hypothetical protein